MKLSKTLTVMLAAMGIQLPSCIFPAYGCPIAYFNNVGTVKDESGKGIGFAKLEIEEIDTLAEPQKWSEINRTFSTDSSGWFESNINTEDPKTMKCRLIASMEGYEPDTTVFDVKKSEFLGARGRFEGAVTKVHHIVLKKKNDKDMSQ